MKKMCKLLILFVCIIFLCFGFAACNIDNEGGNAGVEETIGNDGPDFATESEIKSAFTKGSMTLKVTSDNVSTYFTIIQTDSGYFYSAYDTPKAVLDGSLMIKQTSGYDYYEVTDGKRYFVANSEEDDSYDTYFNSFSAFFTSYTALNNDDFTSSGAAAVAGRACTKYNYTLSTYAGSVQYEYYIDNETDMCLKYVGSIAAGGEKGNYSWEITQLTLGDVSLSAYTSLPLSEME